MTIFANSLAIRQNGTSAPVRFLIPPHGSCKYYHSHALFIFNHLFLTVCSWPFVLNLCSPSIAGCLSTIRSQRSSSFSIVENARRSSVWQVINLIFGWVQRFGRALVAKLMGTIKLPSRKRKVKWRHSSDQKMTLITINQNWLEHLRLKQHVSYQRKFTSNYEWKTFLCGQGSYQPLLL